MIDDVNRIRNPRFSDGKAGPLRWVFSVPNGTARWHRTPQTPGVSISCETDGTSAGWSQTVTCKPEEFYRVEAVVSCDLTAQTDSAGFVLSVQPTADGKSAGQKRSTCGLRRTSCPTTVHATLCTPAGVRRLEVSVAAEAAAGSVTIHEVRLVQVLEPDEESHVLAIPAPPNTLPPVKSAKRLCVCSETAEDRMVTQLLKGAFGRKCVETVSPNDWSSQAVRADAILFPDETPPRAIKSVRSLLQLASDKVVVISLPAFASLSRGALAVRRIEQTDDPTFVKVVYAEFATHGFALHDTFRYSWTGRKEGSHVQRHYRKGKELDAFLKRHGLLTLLESMCDKDVTSNRPLALFKRTDGGALFVFDIEPVESPGTTLDEPALAMHVLLSMLGRLQCGLGQFIAPRILESDFRLSIREMRLRFRYFNVHAEDVPIDEVHEQIVTIGGGDFSLGLPLRPKPVILVRTGMTAGDVAAVHGAFLWFKQLIRMEPHVCRYADALATKFRLAWVPSAAPWEAPEGWRPTETAPDHDCLIETDGGEIVAMIDIVSRPFNRVRVALPGLDEAHAHFAEWLPQLRKAFSPGRYFAPGPPEGTAFADRSKLEWRHLQHEIVVEECPDLFLSAAHQAVRDGGGEVIRMEVPDDGASFTAHSIQRTDLTATLLEHVIGLMYGLIAVNRTNASITLNGFSPVAPGEALIIDRLDPILQRQSARAS